MVDHDRASRPGLAIGLFFLTALLLILNLYPEKMIAIIGWDGEVFTLPLAGPGLFEQTGLINLTLLASIVVNAVVLFRGRWNTLLRWLEIGTHVLTIVLLVRLIQAPDVIAIDTSHPAFADHGDRVVEILHILIRVAFGIGIAGTLISLIADSIKAVRRMKPF